MKSWLRSLVLFAACCGLLFARPASARADDVAQAKEHAERGLSAFALGQYARAAAEYEKAFELKADPALLYNAAQALRLAGNKPRALLLYQSYLMLFPNPQNRSEVERHIAELKQAIESEKRAVSAPPTEPMAEKGGATREAPAAAVAPASQPARADLTAAAPERKRLKPWVWGVIGGAAAVALGLGLGLGLGLTQSPSDPTASIGRAMVH